MLEATKSQNPPVEAPHQPGAGRGGEDRPRSRSPSSRSWWSRRASLGFFLPGAFKPLGPSVPYLLGIIMFCMGLTLTPPDFAAVAKRPWAVVLGIVAHYVIMPGAGWLIAVGLNLEPELAVGLILVGCAPSGTASNVMAFLAKGDVALSVAVASVSTLIAPIVTRCWCCSWPARTCRSTPAPWWATSSRPCCCPSSPASSPGCSSRSSSRRCSRHFPGRPPS